MVLPASTATQGEAAQAEWLRQVRRWLHLGHKGVLVMIRDAQLAQLRQLVRMLESVESSLTVTTDARGLLECREGALVLFIVGARDLGWLNLNRPIFEQRSLRVVLWVEPELSVRLKFESPDLHDWISHFVRCPAGVPEFAVEGLRIGSGWWPGVAWRGPGLDLALEQLKIEVTTLRPDAEFDSLVPTLSADHLSNVRWVGVDSLRALWRVRWALAEARHRGFCVLDQPSVSTPGWFPVRSLQLEVDEAQVLLEGANGLRRAIELEFEPEQILPKQDDVDDEVEVGLLLRPGPVLRRLHGSSEIADWRRQLVRAIWRDPDHAWSRAELAVFASFGRDSDQWPSWGVQHSKMGHSTEHILRITADSELLLPVPSLTAALLRDAELNRRWSIGGLANPYLGIADWVSTSPVSTASEALLLGRSLGWDEPGVVRATALVAEQLLDHADELRAFISAVRESAQADLGPQDESLLALIQIAAIAIALAGDPWEARNRLQDVGAKWPGSLPFGPDYAAARTLCGEYSNAADLLSSVARGDSPETRLYVTVLLAAGYPERARAELERLLGEPRDPSDYLGDEKSANDRARQYLRARLHALAHPIPISD